MEILPEHEVVPVADGYELKKDVCTNTIYCLRNGQTIADRMITRKKIPLKPNFSQDNKPEVCEADYEELDREWLEKEGGFDMGQDGQPNLDQDGK